MPIKYFNNYKPLLMSEFDSERTDSLCIVIVLKIKKEVEENEETEEQIRIKSGITKVD